MSKKALSAPANGLGPVVQIDTDGYTGLGAGQKAPPATPDEDLEALIQTVAAKRDWFHITRQEYTDRWGKKNLKGFQIRPRMGAQQRLGRMVPLTTRADLREIIGGRIVRFRKPTDRRPYPNRTEMLEWILDEAVERIEDNLMGRPPRGHLVPQPTLTSKQLSSSVFDISTPYTPYVPLKMPDAYANMHNDPLVKAAIENCADGSPVSTSDFQVLMNLTMKAMGVR